MIFRVDDTKPNCKFLSISNTLLELHLDFIARNGTFVDFEAIEETKWNIVVEIIMSLIECGMSIVRSKVNLDVVIVVGSSIVTETSWRNHLELEWSFLH